MNKISDAQEHILLENFTKRIICETCVGLFTGTPLGIMVYFFALAVYCVAMGALGATLQSFVILPQPFVQSLTFGPAAIVLLAVLSTCGTGYITRCVIPQGYRVLAWVQLPLMLLGVAVMCALTLTYHKPPLPFAGQ
jgi:hypothetical protein